MSVPQTEPSRPPAGQSTTSCRPLRPRAATAVSDQEMAPDGGGGGTGGRMAGGTAGAPGEAGGGRDGRRAAAGAAAAAIRPRTASRRIGLDFMSGTNARGEEIDPSTTARRARRSLACRLSKGPGRTEGSDLADSADDNVAAGGPELGQDPHALRLAVGAGADVDLELALDRAALGQHHVEVAVE